MADLQAVRTRYKAEKTLLLQSIGHTGATGRDVHKALGRLAQLADGVLQQLWTHAGMPSPLALLAVGGYGRGELFPFSDVDVLVLMHDALDPDQDADLKSRIESFIGSCWDTGLEIGSSVRTLSTCLAEAAKDVTVRTALL